MSELNNTAGEGKGRKSLKHSVLMGNTQGDSEQL